MSSMQAFYTNLTNVALPGVGEVTLELPVQAVQPKPAVAPAHVLHQEMLTRLTHLSLPELLAHKSKLGWAPWW